jgi:hypothetical protein
MLQPIDRLFIAHPRSAGQGYFAHLWFAWRFGAHMLRGALAAFGHGLLPCTLTSSASRIVRELQDRLGGSRESESCGSR